MVPVNASLGGSAGPPGSRRSPRPYDPSVSGHALHPMRNDWWAKCPECFDMVCRECGHSRDSHSDGQGCVVRVGPGDELNYCHCNQRKVDSVAFRDPEGR
jgi:hypothetical protein